MPKDKNNQVHYAVLNTILITNVLKHFTASTCNMFQMFCMIIKVSSCPAQSNLSGKKLK